jgi:hypothetical protein
MATCRAAKLRHMGLHSAAAADRRDPVNELYDCASQLLQAARKLNVAAAPIHDGLQRDRREHSPVARAALAELEALRRALAQACRTARSARRAVGRLGAETEVA